MRIFIVAFASLLLVSCHYFGGERITGNGHITSQQRDAGSFNSVDVSGQVVLHIRQDASTSVKIETDENLLSYLDVFTDGNTLVIRTKQGYNLDPSKDIVAYVSAPVFKDLDASGQCDIIGDGPIEGNEPLSIQVSGQGTIKMEVNLPKLSTDISGQGEVELKGSATDFVSQVSGQGNIKCFDLITNNTTLDISGSSDVQITVNKELNVDASGSSTVEYKGNGTVRKNDTSGSSSVKKVG